LRHSHRTDLTLLFLSLLVLAVSPVMARSITNMRIVSAPRATPEVTAAVRLLREELNKRSGSAVDGGGAVIVAARREEVADLLSEAQRRQWRKWLQSAPPRHAEAYCVLSLDNTLILAGDDDRGILFGVGYLLRKSKMQPGRVRLPMPIDVRAVPQKAWRAHQIGYRFKNNSYDAFTLAMFEQHIRDLAVFGANGVQWIAPVSDDAPLSPLFPEPPLEMAVGVSQLTKQYGLDFHLYYPEMGEDYGKPAIVAAELVRFEDLVSKLRKVDSLFVPGGDPGHTAPDLLFPLVQRQAAILHRYHPRARVWISAQGFDRAAFERFYALLNAEPRWLTGVFVGPQSRDGVDIQRARIPRQYPVLFYPDIAHTFHSQFPLPQWDPAFALTQGREPVNPRPAAMTHIVRHFTPHFAGFVTYSEGVTDDVNKMLWSALGWDVNGDTNAILGDYGRYFIGDERFGASLAALERAWEGPVVANTSIAKTLVELEAIQAPDNWRYEMALYRAIYDLYVQRRATAEKMRYESATKALRAANVSEARAALTAPDDAQTSALRERLFYLADKLYRAIGLQLSVKLYGASAVERGANLDGVDATLNDKVWLLQQLDQIETLVNPAQRQARLHALTAAEISVPGALYDDLGDPWAEPHLVRGEGFAMDPGLYRSAIDGIADKTPDDGWRMSWVTYAETLYETPIHLRYERLDTAARYRLRMVYAGEDYALPIILTAGKGTVLHDFMPRTVNPMMVELDVPQSLTADGMLDLYWTRPAGLGGSGRGHQVAQVWLYLLQ
jgi:hypothetical protein